MSRDAKAASQPAIPSISPVFSDRVRIARALCIFLMTFVHVPVGIAENADGDAGFFGIVYFIFTRLLGLSSVSLLSVVSSTAAAGETVR